MVEAGALDVEVAVASVADDVAAAGHDVVPPESAPPGRMVIENKVSSDIGSTTNRNRDVVKRSSFSRPPHTLFARQYVPLH